MHRSMLGCLLALLVTVPVQAQSVVPLNGQGSQQM